jgi:isocitrate lyase
MGVPTVIIARTDANAARLVTSDVDPNDQPFLTGKRTFDLNRPSQDGSDVWTAVLRAQWSHSVCPELCHLVTVIFRRAK